MQFFGTQSIYIGNKGPSEYMKGMLLDTHTICAWLISCDTPGPYMGWGLKQYLKLPNEIGC